MRIHWGFIEEILSLLAKAAISSSDPEHQTELLKQASPLLWRFSDQLLPSSVEELKTMLVKDIGTWLPKSVNPCYSGHLLANGKATMLAETILIDAEGNSLALRDQAISQALADTPEGPNRPEFFRDLVDSYSFPGLLESSAPYPLAMRDLFYDSIPATRSEENTLVTCSTCSYPLDLIENEFQCKGYFCSNKRHSNRAPYHPIGYKKNTTNLVIKKFQHQKILKHIYWLTIASPLVMEQRILENLKLRASDEAVSSIELHKTQPGLSIIEKSKKITFLPVSTYSKLTLERYFLNTNQPNETWLIVPALSFNTFVPLKSKLQKNKIQILTTSSYTEHYLERFYSSATKSGPRVRSP